MIKLAITVLLTQQDAGKKSTDWFTTTFESTQKSDKNALNQFKVKDAWQAAIVKGATLETRFKYGTFVVCAFDKSAISRSDSKFHAQEASKLFTSGDLKRSPMCGYVVARLGLIHLRITKLEVEGAKQFYDARHSGVAANVYARVLSFDASLSNRASSLKYALEAQSKQTDSVKLRWLVGGAYFFKADFTKEKLYWQSAIKEYEKALEIAKSGRDKDFTEGNLETIRFYLKRAKEYLKKATG